MEKTICLHIFIFILCVDVITSFAHATNLNYSYGYGTRQSTDMKFSRRMKKSLNEQTLSALRIFVEYNNYINYELSYGESERLLSIVTTLLQKLAGIFSGKVLLILLLY